MSDILRELKKSAEKYKLKQIAIPTEKELYNLIINIYLTKFVFNAVLYVKKDFLYYAFNYIQQITKQLKLKLKNGTYNFTIEALTKYIDKSIKCDFLDFNNDIFNIASDNLNLTYKDLLQDPLTYFNTKLNTDELLEHTPNKAIKRYIKEFMQHDFLTAATNKTIDHIKQFAIFNTN